MATAAITGEADSASAATATLSPSPATVSGSKTCASDCTPDLPATLLTSLLATAPENLTIGNLQQLRDAAATVDGGSDPNRHPRTLLT